MRGEGVGRVKKMGKSWKWLPSGYVKIAIENDHL
jgi:hypothetical protein